MVLELLGEQGAAGPPQPWRWRARRAVRSPRPRRWTSWACSTASCCGSARTPCHPRRRCSTTRWTRWRPPRCRGDRQAVRHGRSGVPRARRVRAARRLPHRRARPLAGRASSRSSWPRAPLSPRSARRSPAAAADRLPARRPRSGRGDRGGGRGRRGPRCHRRGPRPARRGSGRDRRRGGAGRAAGGRSDPGRRRRRCGLHRGGGPAAPAVRGPTRRAGGRHRRCRAGGRSAAPAGGAAPGRAAPPAGARRSPRARRRGHRPGPAATGRAGRARRPRTRLPGRAGRRLCRGGRGRRAPGRGRGRLGRPGVRRCHGRRARAARPQLRRPRPGTHPAGRGDRDGCRARRRRRAAGGPAGRLAAVLGLLLAAAAGSVGTARSTPVGSPASRRAVDVLEAVLVAAAVPLALGAMDVFALVRGL